MRGQRNATGTTRTRPTRSRQLSTLPTKSTSSKRADQMAGELIRELRSKGYDPTTGDLFKNNSDCSESVEDDRYLQSREAEWAARDDDEDSRGPEYYQGRDQADSFSAGSSHERSPRDARRHRGQSLLTNSTGDDITREDTRSSLRSRDYSDAYSTETDYERGNGGPIQTYTGDQTESSEYSRQSTELLRASQFAGHALGEKKKISTGPILPNVSSPFSYSAGSNSSSSISDINDKEFSKLVGESLGRRSDFNSRDRFEELQRKQRRVREQQARKKGEHTETLLPRGEKHIQKNSTRQTTNNGRSRNLHHMKSSQEAQGPLKHASNRRQASLERETRDALPVFSHGGKGYPAQMEEVKRIVSSSLESLDEDESYFPAKPIRGPQETPKANKRHPEHVANVQDPPVPTSVGYPSSTGSPSSTRDSFGGTQRYPDSAAAQLADSRTAGSSMATEGLPPLGRAPRRFSTTPAVERVSPKIPEKPKKTGLFRRWLRPSKPPVASTPQTAIQSPTPPQKPLLKPNSDVGLVTREELFQELQERGISSKPHRWEHYTDKGSLVGQMIAPKHAPNDIETEALTETEIVKESMSSESLEEENESVDMPAPEPPLPPGKPSKKNLKRHRTPPRKRGDQRPEEEEFPRVPPHVQSNVSLTTTRPTLQKQDFATLRAGKAGIRGKIGEEPHSVLASHGSASPALPPKEANASSGNDEIDKKVEKALGRVRNDNSDPPVYTSAPPMSQKMGTCVERKENVAVRKSRIPSPKKAIAGLVKQVAPKKKENRTGKVTKKTRLERNRGSAPTSPGQEDGGSQPAQNISPGKRMIKLREGGNVLPSTSPTTVQQSELFRHSVESESSSIVKLEPSNPHLEVREAQNPAGLAPVKRSLIIPASSAPGRIELGQKAQVPQQRPPKNVEAVRLVQPPPTLQVEDAVPPAKSTERTTNNVDHNKAPVLNKSLPLSSQEPAGDQFAATTTHGKVSTDAVGGHLSKQGLEQTKSDAATLMPVSDVQNVSKRKSRTGVPFTQTRQRSNKPPTLSNEHKESQTLTVTPTSQESPVLNTQTVACGCHDEGGEKLRLDDMLQSASKKFRDSDSQGTLGNSIETNQATTQASIEAELHEMQAPRTMMRVSSGAPNAACGQLGFMFPTDLDGDFNKKGVRFSEDLALVHEIPAAMSGSVTVDTSSNQGPDVGSTVGAEIVSNTTSQKKPKKKGLFAFMRRKNRGRQASHAADSESEYLEESSFDDSNSSESDYTPAKRGTGTIQHGKQQHEEDQPRRNQTTKAIANSAPAAKPSVTQPIPSNNRVTPPHPPMEDGEGIELIARRTKSGKNAILIAKSANPRFDIPPPSNSVNLQMQSVVAPKEAEQNLKKAHAQNDKKGSLRLRLFNKSSKNVDSAPVTRKPVKSTVQSGKEGRNRNSSPLTAATADSGSVSSKSTEEKQQSQESHPLSNTQSKKLISNQSEIAQKNREPVQIHQQGPQPGPSSATGTSTAMDSREETSGIGYSMSAATDAADPGYSVASAASSLLVEQGTKTTIGSDTYTYTTAGDLFSWLLPGVFAPIPVPKQRSRSSDGINKAGNRVHANNISTSSTSSKMIDDKQWQDILSATETLAVQYKEAQKMDDDASHSISEETIREVNNAIAKFKEHAARLGLKEKELLEAVRQDDRSLYSVGLKDSLSARTQGGFVHNVGGATDKFIQMFEYYFSPAGAESSYEGSINSTAAYR